ncbi:hypothetical protein RIR_e36809_A0A2N1NAN5_9GLOM [Rhizophagus irregularis DAOM 181602=DAOM 197198]|nr:hypothetical protein RIR_e36809_A0A2N1NAN5_9GLOM [Rhizophagus irregularis DAOM 181602=DAOM 197198]
MTRINGNTWFIRIDLNLDHWSDYGIMLRSYGKHFFNNNSFPIHFLLIFFSFRSDQRPLL